MVVSKNFENYIRELLDPICNYRMKKMFGGLGIYADELFFAMISEDILYLKTNEETRLNFERLGKKAFIPFKHKKLVLKNYYEIPDETLDDEDLFKRFILDSINVAHK